MGMARYNKMNQTVLLRTPESSNLNQKYDIAIQSIAVPRIPGHTRHRTNKAADELDSKDTKPADPNAMRLAMMTPTRENAATAQAKYVRFAAGETIQLRRIGRYSICRRTLSAVLRVIQPRLTRRSRDGFSGRLGSAQKTLGVHHNIAP